MNNKAILACAAAVLSSVSMASATPTDDTTTHSKTPVKVSMMTVGGSTMSLLTFKNPDGSFAICSATASAQFFVSRSHPSHEQLYKAATAALLSGRNITVDYELVSNYCWVKRISFLANPF